MAARGFSDGRGLEAEEVEINAAGETLADALCRVLDDHITGPGSLTARGHAAAPDLKVLDDEVVLAFAPDMDTRQDDDEEPEALAAVFALTSPRTRELLKESFFNPASFYLGGDSARLVVDPIPEYDDEELYSRVGATVVADEQIAARELLTVTATATGARHRREREVLGSPSRLERLRADMRTSWREPALSTGQLEAQLESPGRTGLLGRLSGSILAFFGLGGARAADPAPGSAGPTWKRRIPEAAAEIIQNDPCPGVAVVTNNKGGTGKCVTYDTSLTDPVTGLRHTIEEFVQNPGLERVHTLEDRRTAAGIGITSKVDSGVQPTLKVRLRSGRSITVTRHHPLLMPDGWREAQNIAVGETVALAGREPFPEEPADLSDAEVVLLAAMLAEGGTAGSNKGFTSADEDILGLVSAAAGELGMVLRPRPSVKYQYELCNRDPRDRDSRRRGKVRAFLDRHGLSGRLARNKRILEAVYRLGPAQLSQFLAVFWMCDGYVDRSEGPGVTLASRGMVEDLQHLLLRFGIQSRVGYKKSCYTATNGERREFDAYRLMVYSQYRAKFRDAIPLWGAKRVSLDVLCERSANPNCGSPTMSEKLRRALRTAAFGSPEKRSRGGGGHVPGGARSIGGRGDVTLQSPPSTEDVRDLLGWSAFQMDFLEHRKANGTPPTVARRPFAAFCEVFGLREEYRWLLDSLSGDSDVFWDTVVAIEDAGDQQVYDLMVEPTHCFIANDVVVHNTTISCNLAAAASLICLPKGWQHGLSVLLIEQNYGNSDIRDRVRTPGSVGRGLLGFVSDLRSGADPDIIDYVTPVSGLPDLDTLLISDRDDEYKHAGTLSESELDALYESAADYYSLIVVDLDKGLPQEPTMVADVLRYWLTVCDVTFLVLDGSGTSHTQALKFSEGAHKFFDQESVTGGEPRPLVPVKNKWREGERWGASADDPEEWDRLTRQLGADWAVDRHGNRVPYLKVPDDPQCDAFARQARQIALADEDFALTFEEMARDWIDRVVQSRLAEVNEQPNK